MSKVIDDFVATRSGKKLLSKEEEHKFSTMAKKEKIKHLVTNNIRLVYDQAQHFKNAIPSGVDFDELISNGLYGLQLAAERFDFNRNVKFVTYAYFWIKKYMVMHLNVESRQHTISDDRKTFVISLDGPAFPTDDSSASEYSFVSEMDGEDAADILEKKELKQMLSTFINKYMTKREQFIIKHRFLSETKATLKELADMLDVSIATLKQEENHCMAKLKHLFATHEKGVGKQFMEG
jgi:RNA polymerase sigma factor (sigma-70 family)